MTRSGCDESSESEDIQAGFMWVVMENFEWKTLEGPVIQGSKRIVNGRGFTVPWANSGMIGSKDKRNEASELRCFTVTAIANVGVVDSLVA